MIIERLNTTVLAAMVLAAGIAHDAWAAPIPIAYWRFDNDGKSAGQPADTVLDAIGGNHGTAFNGPVYSSDVFGSPVVRTGAANTLSMAFDRGSAQRIIVPHDDSISFGNSSFTIEAYVKFDSLPASGATRQHLVTKKATTGVADTMADYLVVFANSGSYGATSNGELVLAQGNGASTQFTQSGLAITDTDSWHYVSVGFDADNQLVRFILDDESVTVPNTFEAATNLGDLMIGGHVAASNALTAFNGSIDELRMSSGFLPASQLLNVPEPGALLVLATAVLAVLPFGRQRRVRRQR